MSKKDWRLLGKYQSIGTVEEFEKLKRLEQEKMEQEKKPAVLCKDCVYANKSFKDSPCQHCENQKEFVQK